MLLTFLGLQPAGPGYWDLQASIIMLFVPYNKSLIHIDTYIHVHIYTHTYVCTHTDAYLTLSVSPESSKTALNSYMRKE